MSGMSISAEELDFLRENVMATQEYQALGPELDEIVESSRTDLLMPLP